jgi:hypothetical protein
MSKVITKKDLNDDQTAALEFMEAFIKGPNHQMLLTGPAGTGKTALLNVLLSEYKGNKNFPIVCTAPTNKAVSVISASTGKTYNKTICALLGLVLVDTGHGKPILKQQGECSIQQYSLVVIDEASMLDEKMIDKIRWIRTGDNNLGFFPMDFQNDGEFVGGCIAGGRNYFHINANGDAEPCVFIHFSNTNIHEHHILEMLQSPLFMAYHEGQPFNRNHLRPCPMLENPELLREMVDATGAHGTNSESEESVEQLCSKCDDYAAGWAPIADEIWASQKHHKKAYENYSREKIEHPELAAFEHVDGSDRIESADEKRA